MEEADVIILWGANTAEAHPIAFHHMMRGVRRHGTKLVIVDPRRITGSEFATLHLPVRVGSDVALANAVGQAMIEENLVNREFIDRATEHYEEYAKAVADYRPEDVEEITGVTAEDIRQLARLYAGADRAIIAWTLGITEHHNAVDSVHSLINLSLLTGHVGRSGSGLAPMRGQNNVQGGGDSGALPNKLPGFLDVTSPEARERCSQVWGAPVPYRVGMHQSAMMEAMENHEMRVLFVIGENPIHSEANSNRVRKILEGLDLLVVQDIFLTATAEMADVVLPGSAAFAESDGTVTNSERRVQLLRKALDPPGDARDDRWIIEELAVRMGAPGNWAHRTAEEVWDELRQISPLHGGMSYARLAEHGGLQWPCPTEDHPGTVSLHGRLWQENVGRRAPFSARRHRPTAEVADETYPLLLTTGRRLAAYNTGVQTRFYKAPRGHHEALEMAAQDMARLGIGDGALCRVVSRRGEVTVKAIASEKTPEGLVFMSLNHPEEAWTNVLTLDATDPYVGTSEFKASAVRVEPVAAEGGES